jgi:insertion element IS1 protein InsB
LRVKPRGIRARWTYAFSLRRASAFPCIGRIFTQLTPPRAWRISPNRLSYIFTQSLTKVLAYVFGRRKDTVFLALKALLEPFGITRYFTDGWGAYERHVEAEQHTVGKENTQKIESKHINWRTRIKRLVRRTICFSKTERMHDLVIGVRRTPLSRQKRAIIKIAYYTYELKYTAAGVR